MNADVSRSLARFIASLNLDREVAREVVAQFTDVEDVAGLPEWVREVDDDPAAASDVRAADATRARPYPGQRYRHGWIPVAAAPVDLAAAVDSGVADQEELTGGEMGTVSLVTHNNGTKTVHKRLEDISDVFGDAFPPERQADAEELSALLGSSIGAPIPQVLRIGDDEIHIEHVDGEVAVGIEGRLYEAARTPEDFAAVKQRTAEQTARIVGTPEGIRLGVFDILTGNWDRANTSNWMVTPDGKPVGIDHSFTFFDDSEAENPPPMESLGPFAALFVRRGTGPKGRNGRDPTEWDDNPLTRADIDWLRERLADVEDDFDRAGRHDWWEFASGRLEAIAPHATGTESRFG